MSYDKSRVTYSAQGLLVKICFPRELSMSIKIAIREVHTRCCYSLFFVKNVATRQILLMETGLKLCYPLL
jgi:hypothetical protein